MTDLIYRKYEENKGFEEYQAEVYNSVAKKYNAQPVTAEGIKKRLHDHKPEQDRNGMTFVFDNNKPIAYIQYREYAQGKIRIGYPWAIEGTSQEVKDKLFYDLFEYVKKKYPTTKKFYVGFLNHAFTDILDDVQNHYGFKEDTTFATYTFEVGKASNLPLPKEYSFKEATEKDIEILVSIGMSDENTSKMGAGALKEFFKERFFTLESKERIAIILLKGNEPMGMAALSKTKERGKDYSNLRVKSLKKGEEESFQYLLSATGKLLREKNWIDPISMSFSKVDAKKEEMTKKIGGDFVSKAYEFVFELK